MQEAQWNTQFIKESIPDIFVGKSNPNPTQARKESVP